LRRIQQHLTEYFERAAQQYGGPKGWRKALNGLINRMKINDLVWFREPTGVYYLARVTGDWRHDSSKGNIDVDIINVRTAELYRVGVSVAGKIAACFRAQATLQTISGPTALHFSQLTFNTLCGRTHYRIEPGTRDVFDLCSDLDLEDVVLVYLQSKHKYLLIPSSRRADTLAYEYVLKGPNGEEAVAQVKSGGIILNPGRYRDMPCKVFLFSPADYTSDRASNVTLTSRRELEEFMRTQRSLLPMSIQLWLNWLDSAG
jgi:hypothetical protein